MARRPVAAANTLFLKRSVVVKPPSATSQRGTFMRWIRLRGPYGHARRASAPRVGGPHGGVQPRGRAGLSWLAIRGRSSLLRRLLTAAVSPFGHSSNAGSTRHAQRSLESRRDGAGRQRGLAADDPAPYERALTALAVTPGKGPIAFKVVGSELITTGAPKHLRTLAQNVESFATHEDPDDQLSHGANGRVAASLSPARRRFGIRWCVLGALQYSVGSARHGRLASGCSGICSTRPLVRTRVARAVMAAALWLGAVGRFGGDSVQRHDGVFASPLGRSSRSGRLHQDNEPE
jgi:hypothetical protein